MSGHDCGIKVGETVPDFKMETYEPSRGEFGEVSLSALREKKKWTILFFYPADFTFVCATEFAALANLQDNFREMGAEIITVSTDTKFVHLAWQRDEKMLEKAKYTMAADPTGRMARMFGVYDDEGGVALRGTFIISPEGKLLNKEVNYFNLGRNIDELLRKVTANIYLGEHGDEACPVGWQAKGDKTLKPSEKLVGKVYEAMK
jgi:alkyl hydroperoxide reductase subunit AhpC